MRRPRLCAGLFVTNAIGYDAWPIPRVKAMRALGGLLRHLPNAVLKQLLRTFYRRGHDAAACAEEALAHHWPHYARHGGAAAFVRQVRALDIRDTLEVAGDIERLNGPARVVWGAADRFLKIEYGERFAEDLSAPLYRIPNGRHFTPEDHPDEVAAGIQQLLEEAAIPGATRQPRYG